MSPIAWMERTRISIRRLNNYRRVTGLGGLLEAAKGKISQTQTLVQLTRPGLRFPLFLRVPSSDPRTFDQIFVRKEYGFEVSRMPEVIVDAGANIGLTSIYFTNRYPDAKIIALEPEGGNFELLQKNVAPYENIVPIRAALWHKNETITLVDPGLGEWGFMTQGSDSAENLGAFRHEVPALTVDAVMEAHGLTHIDILKVDIEGAEREVFQDSSAWLNSVDVLIVELHERMKSGCNRSFYRGSEGFDDEWVHAENVYLSRRGSCLVRPSSWS